MTVTADFSEEEHLYQVRRRRAGYVLTMLGVLLGLALGCNRPPPPPDVVLVVIDTLRADSLGYAGHERPTSPNLDQLAAESTWFSRAYSPSTWTLPAVTSMLTGLYAFQHGVVRDWRSPSLYGRLEKDVPTLPGLLAMRGYRTAAFLNNSFLAPDFHLQRGWDLYDYQGASLAEHRTAQKTVEDALAWLDSSKQPALAMIHLMEPHTDYTAPPPFAGQFTNGIPHTVSLPLGDSLISDLLMGKQTLSPEDKGFVRRAYDEEILTTDAALGHLFQALRARAGWESIRLIVTSDHGEEFWEFGGFEHGHTNRSVVTQVPLLVKAPGVVPGRNGSVIDLTEIMDALLDDPQSELLRLARSGTTERGRYALSENILYGPQELSIVTDDLRLIINQEQQLATLLELDQRGWETLDLSMDPSQRQRGKTLHEALLSRRGDLSGTAATNSLSIPNSDVFEQLRALGYVE